MTFEFDLTRLDVAVQRKWDSWAGLGKLQFSSRFTPNPRYTARRAGVTLT